MTAQIGSSSVEIWSGRQQDLFSKYRAKRSQTMETIKANLIMLKDDLD